MVNSAFSSSGRPISGSSVGEYTLNARMSILMQLIMAFNLNVKRVFDKLLLLIYLHVPVLSGFETVCQVLTRFQYISST